MGKPNSWHILIVFIHRAQKPFLTSIALALKKQSVYVPTERLPGARLYVLYQGLCRYHGSTMTIGSHFGERDVLMWSMQTKRPTAVAITYAHVHFIDREQLEQNALEFPVAYKAMRRWVIFQAIKDFLLQYAREQRLNHASDRAMKYVV